MKNKQLCCLLLAGIIIHLFFGGCSGAKKSRNIAKEEIAGRILFYNVENLFDTINQEGHRDGEFIPGSEKHWNTERYNQKLLHISQVIAAADTGFLPDIIGLAEVENRQVVEDLIQTPLLRKAGYHIIHRDCPDFRGIDVALVYDEKYLPLKNTFYEIELPGEHSTTRDLLYSKGVFLGDTLHIFVNHWPSRYGGKKKSDPKRAFVAAVLRSKVDSLFDAGAAPKIVIMGDFNDYPQDSSIAKILKALPESTGKPDELINLAWATDASGAGSYNYRGHWGALDQMIVSGYLLSGKKWHVTMDSYRVVKRPWMMYTNDKGEQYPSRTYGGPNYYGGYSDHLPVILKVYK